MSTESERIAELAQSYGAPVIHRPEELATDEATSGMVLHHALLEMEADGKEFDAVVCLHPTSPFRTEVHIDAAIEIYENTYHRRAKTLASVRQLPLKAHPNVRAGLGWCSGGLVMNGAIYVVNTDYLKHFKSHVSRDCTPYLMDQKSSIDIDTPLDWVIAEAVMRHENKRQTESYALPARYVGTDSGDLGARG